ncbi:MAG TPA: aminotransferase class I/II-fold pyridoxal phosphate-dependent enzyme [Candidatus Paceibacterota bacterium]
MEKVMNPTSSKLVPLLVRGLTLPTTLSRFGIDHPIACDLAKCENCKASPLALEAVRRHVEGRMLSDHWESQPEDLRQHLAEIYDVDVKQVFLVSGGMGGVQYAFGIFTQPRTRVGLLRPDFPFWWFAAKARTGAFELKSGTFPFAHSVESIVQFVHEKRIQFLVLANPNAALGTKKSLDDIESLVKSAPNTVFIIDESDAIETDSSAHLTSRYENMCVIGSFSKWLGLAGLRVGFMVVPPRYTEHFGNFINPVELTSYGMVAASAVLGHIAFQRETQERVQANLRLLESACVGTRYQIVPGSSCFASYLWTDEGPEDPCVVLADHGVQLAPAAFFGLDRGGRINLSDPPLIRAAADMIRAIAPR